MTQATEINGRTFCLFLQSCTEEPGVRGRVVAASR